MKSWPKSFQIELDAGVLDARHSRRRREYQHHRTIHYAWGEMTILEKKADFWVDRMVIYPGQTFENTLTADCYASFVAVKGQIVAKWADQYKIMTKGETLLVEHPNVLLVNRKDQPATLIRVTSAIASV